MNLNEWSHIYRWARQVEKDPIRVGRSCSACSEIWFEIGPDYDEGPLWHWWREEDGWYYD